MSSRWRRVLRRGALLAGALGAAGTLVSAASFALFTSTAQAQTDSFAAGTVILTSLSGNNNCTTTGVSLTNLEPGDSGTCTYNLTYKGSLNAWVVLSAAESATALATYTPKGSVTPIGGEALLTNGNDKNALQVSFSDTWGNTLAQPTVTCPNSDTSTAEGSGALGASTACNGAGLYLLKDNGNAAGNTNNNPAYSWTPSNSSDTITITWNLPITAPNTYQGSSAQIVLQGEAVQASNNPLVNGWPTYGPGPQQVAVSFSYDAPSGDGVHNYCNVLLDATHYQPNTSYPVDWTVTGTAGPSSGTASLKTNGLGAFNGEIFSYLDDYGNQISFTIGGVTTPFQTITCSAPA